MTETNNRTFCDEMRKATKEIHAISDALVNAKLAFAFHDDRVWADGLLVFYEVFKYLEKAMTTLKNQCGIDNLIIPELKRTKAFERDLNYYLGNDWMKNYSPRESVMKYLSHLQKIENNEPIFLVAYVYHLYMGLLSGGIILRKKRQLMRKISLFTRNDPSEGYNVTDFGNSSLHELKKQLRCRVNEIADTLSEITKQQLIDESKIVYSLNNEIIKSVQGANAVLAKTIFYAVIFIIVILLLFYFII